MNLSVALIGVAIVFSASSCERRDESDRPPPVYGDPGLLRGPPPDRSWAEGIPRTNLVWLGSANERCVAAGACSTSVRNLRRDDSPLVIDLNGDGRGEVVGLVTSQGGYAAPAVLDGATLRPLWVGELIRNAPGPSVPLVEATERAVLIATGDRQIIAFDANTGVERGQISAIGNVSAVCADRHLMHIRVDGEADLLFDSETFRFAPTIGAARCTPEPRPRDACDGLPGCVDTGALLVQRVGGDRAGPRSVRASGTTGTDGWTLLVGDAAEPERRTGLIRLDGEDVFVSFEGSGRDPLLELIAIEWRHGRIKWRSRRLEADALGFYASPSHVYVAGYHGLEAFDRGTGRMTGRLDQKPW